MFNGVSVPNSILQYMCSKADRKMTHDLTYIISRPWALEAPWTLPQDSIEQGYSSSSRQTLLIPSVRVFTYLLSYKSDENVLHRKFPSNQNTDPTTSNVLLPGINLRRRSSDPQRLTSKSCTKQLRRSSKSSLRRIESLLAEQLR